MIQLEFDKTTVDRFNHVINEIVKDLDKKTGSELHKFLVETGENLATAVKRTPLMPVKTGRLRASVHSKSKATDSYGYADDFGGQFNGSLKEPIMEGGEVVIGTNVEYAAKMESLRGFFYNTVAQNTGNINKALDNLAKKVIKK